MHRLRPIARRIVALSLFVLAGAGTAAATDSLTITSVVLDRPTLHCLGVQVLISDDDDFDAAIAVRWREPAGTWRNAPPLFRVRPASVTGRVVPPQFAGTIFDLRPGTAYEIELHAVDADGPVDDVRLLNATTRPVPRADPMTPRIVPVSTTAGLTTALGAARAGDVILLADGVYTGSFFTITRSGTAADPIVLRGQSQAGAIIAGGNCTGCNIFEIDGSYIHVENLTLQNAERAIRFQGASTIGNVVRRVTIRDVVHGIGSRAGQLDFLISDCVIEGRLQWPLLYSDDAGLHADDQGVRVEGSGHVVSHCRISGFGDPLINFADGGRAYDFHGNELIDIYGDGTELDRAEGNVRCFHNRWTNVFTAISMQPIHGGPAYVLRNVVVNVADEQLKLKSLGGTIEPSGVLIQHNTFVSPGLALNLQTPITQHDFDLGNNIFIGPDVTTRGYTVDWTAALDRGVFDWNGYWPDGTFWLGTVGATRRIYPSFAAAQAAGVEPNGRLLRPPFFASGLVAPASYLGSLPPQDVTLSPASNAVDGGRVLAGINESFSGAAPDLGAWERDCPLPIYGPRPLGMEDTIAPIDCLARLTAGIDLWRDDSISSLWPLTPSMAAATTALRTPPAYLAGVSPGVTDPDPSVARDPSRPLVLYELSAVAAILRVSKQGATLRLDW